MYSLTRAWTIFLCKTLERQQKFIYWVCNSIQLRCSSAYWIYYRFERENNSLEISWPSEVLAYILLFSSSREIQEDTGYFFSHSKAKVHSQPLSCRVQWVFFNKTEDTRAMGDSLWMLIKGDMWWRSSFILKSLDNLILTFSYVLAVVCIHNSLACCLFSPYFHFITISHWFWEPPGLPRISQRAFLVKRILKFHMNHREAHSALLCILM